jgi:hypothetical protein
MRFFFGVVYGIRYENPYKNRPVPESLARSTPNSSEYHQKPLLEQCAVMTSKTRLKRRKSLMNTNRMPSKPVALEVIVPIDATTHIT